MLMTEENIAKKHREDKEVRFSNTELARIHGGKSSKLPSSNNECCTRNQTQSAEKMYRHEGDYDSAREQENM